MSQIATQEMDVKDAAKVLRKTLAEKFPITKFSVRIDRYSMGESINIHWTDGAASDKVDAVLRDFEEIRRDQFGDILSGCNRFVFGHREISEEVSKRETQALAKMWVDWETIPEHEKQRRVWQKTRETDY